MRISLKWLSEYVDLPALASPAAFVRRRGAGAPAHRRRARGRGDRADGAGAGGGRRGPHRRLGEAPQRREALGHEGRRRGRRAATDRLRREELRGRGRGAAREGRREPPGRPEDREGEAARHRVVRHALLREGAGARRGRERPPHPAEGRGAGHPDRRGAPARRRLPRDQRHPQPAGRALPRRDRARGRRDPREAGPAAGAEAGRGGDAGRERSRGPDRRPGEVPPLRGARHRGGEDRPLAALAAAAAGGVRRPLHLQRGRRDQLRPAGAGPPAPRLRPRQGRRPRDRGPDRARGREDHHARRQGARRSRPRISSSPTRTRAARWPA